MTSLTKKHCFNSQTMFDRLWDLNHLQHLFLSDVKLTKNIFIFIKPWSALLIKDNKHRKGLYCPRPALSIYTYHATLVSPMDIGHLSSIDSSQSYFIQYGGFWKLHLLIMGVDERIHMRLFFYTRKHYPQTNACTSIFPRKTTKAKFFSLLKLSDFF